MALTDKEREAHMLGHMHGFDRPHLSITTRFGVRIAGVTVAPYPDYVAAIRGCTHMVFTFEDGRTAMIACSDISSLIIEDGDVIARDPSARTRTATEPLSEERLLHLLEVAVKGTSEDGGEPITFDTGLTLRFEDDVFVVRDDNPESTSDLPFLTIEDATAHVLACLAKPIRNEEC